MSMNARLWVVPVVFCFLGHAWANDTSETNLPAKICLEGRVRTAAGAPVAGIEVRCLEIDPSYDDEFVWERGRDISDMQGQYAFIVMGDREYRVVTSGRKATFGRTDRFVVSADQDATVADIIVVPASGRLAGRILHTDGTPAAGLLYGCRSENFRPYRALDFPQTTADGGFGLDVLPKEELAFWIIPGPNQVQLWTGLTPGPEARVLRLDPARFLDLPPQWQAMGDVAALARHEQGTKVAGRIAFVLSDLDGRTVSFPGRRFDGKVVIVNFFGTWCGGCQAEMPHLVHLQRKYAARGLAVVTLAFEREGKAAALENVRRFTAEHKVNFPVLFGGRPQRDHVQATIQGIERFQGYPTTIFIDRDGKVAEVSVGFKGESPERTAWQVAQYEKTIQGLLNEPTRDR